MLKPIARWKEAQFHNLDEKLIFNGHIDSVENMPINRLNILRVVSNPSWRPSLATLRQVYNSLVRSLFEYCAIFEPCLKKAIVDKLQIIQNSALRIFLHKPFKRTTSRHTNIEDLHRLSNVPFVKDRLRELAQRYMEKVFHFQNPLINAITRTLLTRWFDTEFNPLLLKQFNCIINSTSNLLSNLAVYVFLNFFCLLLSWLTLLFKKFFSELRLNFLNFFCKHGDYVKI